MSVVEKISPVALIQASGVLSRVGLEHACNGRPGGEDSAPDHFSRYYPDLSASKGEESRSSLCGDELNSNCRHRKDR